MLESRLINSVLPPVIVLFSTWLSICHMLVFSAFLTVHITFCFFYVYFFMSVFLCFYVLFAVCVNGPLWTDYQINGMEWKKWTSRVVEPYLEVLQVFVFTSIC